LDIEAVVIFGAEPVTLGLTKFRVAVPEFTVLDVTATGVTTLDVAATGVTSLDVTVPDVVIPVEMVAELTFALVEISELPEVKFVPFEASVRLLEPLP
jgi:hypothetical protein